MGVKNNTSNSLYYIIIGIAIILIAYFYALKRKFNDISSIIQEEAIEGFQNERTYDQTRDFIINWCNKMEKSGVYSKSDVVQCVNLFDEIGSGALPNEKAKPKTSNEYSYSMYGRRSDDSPSKKLVSSDAERIYLFSNNNSYLTSNDVGKVKLVKSSEFSIGKEVEKEWTLINLGGGVYGIRSYYGNYLIVNDKDEITADQEEPDIWSKWYLKRVNGKYLITASFWKKNLSINRNNTRYAAVIKDQSDNQKWEIIKVPTSEDAIVEYYDKGPMTAEKNKLLGDLQESVVKIVNMNGKIEFNQKIKEDTDLKKMDAIAGVSNYIDQKNNEKKTSRTRENSRFANLSPANRTDPNQILRHKQRKQNLVSINSYTKHNIITDMQRQKDFIVNRIQGYIDLLEKQKDKLQIELRQNAEEMSAWTTHKEDKITEMDLIIKDKEIKIADQIAKLNEQQKRLTFLFKRIDNLDLKDEIVDTNIKNTLDSYSSYKNRPIYIVIVIILILVLSVVMLLRFYRNMSNLRS